MEEKIKNFLGKTKFFLFLFFLILILFGFYYFFGKKEFSKHSYLETYRLVPEKISQSAKIPIFLPPGVDKEYAKKNINFEPKIKGKWAKEKNFFVFASPNEGVIYFQPEEKLKLNHYYLVQLTTPQAEVLKADFLAAEDPKVVAVLPSEGSEAPENSEITIVFNRPMVPLSALDFVENEKEVPVEIYPKTEGRFKWTTTKNLQFIPKERLLRSSNYRVKIKDGFISIDGVRVEGKESGFFTRKLRYLNATSGQISYNQPISIYFNQPVDLEKTKREIILRDEDGKEISFLVEYKKRTEKKERKEREIFGGIFNFLGELVPFQKESKEEIDKSAIEIYQEKDRFGRKRVWDINKGYGLLIKKVYPLEGDILLEESKEIVFFTSSLIKEIKAFSPRTQDANLDFFDPAGSLFVAFYEDIDLKKSKIRARHLKEVGYEGQEKNKVYLKFKENEIGPSEGIEIVFEKIVNSKGLILNQEPLRQIIKSYPHLAVLSVFPEPNSSEADLKFLTICSTTPISLPPKGEENKKIKANLPLKIHYWTSFGRIKHSFESQYCRVGEFETQIHYGLIPLSNYSFEIFLEDVFGQKLTLPFSFKSGEVPKDSLSINHLQPLFNVTTSHKTKLNFVAMNLEYVDLEICKLDNFDFLYFLKDYYHSYSSIHKKIPPDKCQKLIKEKIELPKNYWTNNYFGIDIKKYFPNPTGNYILTLSNPDYVAELIEGKEWRKKQIFEKSYLNITNLGVAEKKINLDDYSLKIPSEELSKLENFYWITNLSNSEPVFGAKVLLYDKNFNLLGTFFSNEKGIVKTPALYDLYFTLVIKGEDTAIIESQESSIERVDDAFWLKKTYLYTDKPIYRPGQQVFVKGIYRVGFDNYKIDKKKELYLTVFDSRDEKILEKKVNVNDFGTFNTDFFLNKNASLGEYRICVKESSCAYIDVQEYVPAPFKVEIKSDKEEYISKDKINLEIEANYYFGVPLEGGEVEYTISSQNYYFDRYQDGYFEFGTPWYYDYDYWLKNGYHDRFILSNKVFLSKEGKAKISEELDLEKLFEKEERKSKIIIVDVSVKNPQGQTVSAQKSFLLHQGSFYLGLKNEKPFVEKDEKFKVMVKSVDKDGKEKKIKGVNLEIYKINWVSSKRMEGKRSWEYQWEKERKLVEKKVFDTDGKGNYSLETKIGEEGEYEIEVFAKDEKGNLVKSMIDFYVYGSGAVSVRTFSDTKLELEAEKKDLKVGEEAKIIIKSPYQKAKALVSIERGKVFDYQIIDIEGNLSVYNFEIKKEYVPNVFVSVLLQSSKPEIKFGRIEFIVDRKEKEIEIEIKSNKRYYLPGEEISLEISTKDKNENPISAELSVAVVDVSVLALKGNPKKNPLIFFYDGFPLTVQTSSNIKNILVDKEIEEGGKGGGMDEEVLARKTRGIFKETAFWQAVVRTNEKGFAKLSFSLPDNLTTWQVEAVGVTKDTKLGVGYQEVTTRKELMAVPLKPRFIVPGDEFFIGAQIFNQTKEKLSVNVKFESQSLLLLDDNFRKLNIEEEKTKTVYFKVKAPLNIEEGEHRFLISAESGKFQDKVVQSIKITPNQTYEVVATSNYTADKVSKEYIFLPDYVLKNKGGISIKSSATLAVFLSDALNYLIHFPYGCAEQIGSQLNAIVIVKRGLKLPNLSDKFQLRLIEEEGKKYSIDELVEIGLSKIYNNQNWDGGFSFWRGGDSNFYLTLYIVNVLHNLFLAGYQINNESLEKAIHYLEDEVTTAIKGQKWEFYQQKEIIILTAYVFSESFNETNFLKEQIIEITKDDYFLNEKASNLLLAQLAILMERGSYPQNLKNKIFNLLDSRIKIDARGAFLENNKNSLWFYYETPIKTTAFYLKAQVAAKRENPLLEKVLRWILNSRYKDGSWGSTNNNLAVIEALTDFLEWKKETESNFKLETFLNEKKEDVFHFKPETILEQLQTEIPIEKLKFKDINTISFIKENFNNLPNNFYYDLSLKYYLPTERIGPRDEGFSIERGFFSLEDKENKKPLLEANVGDVLRVNLKITIPEQRKFVAIEDFIPAGMEIVNLDLATEQKSLKLQEKELKNREFYPDFKELRDDRAFFFKEEVWPGVYEIEYFVRALTKGKFTHLPAVVSEMYFPENFGRTSAGYFEIK